MRRLSLFAVLALAASWSCGGSPTAPTTTAPAISSQTSLANGSYRLTITMSTIGACTTSPICTSLSLCSSFAGTSIVSESLPTGVTLQRSGDTITIRPDATTATFRMTLQQSGSTLTGTAFGAYQSFGTTLAVSDGVGGSAPVTGRILPSFGVSGGLTGDIDINKAGCSNNGHTWTLVPQ